MDTCCSKLAEAVKGEFIERTKYHDDSLTFFIRGRPSMVDDGDGHFDDMSGSEIITNCPFCGSTLPLGVRNMSQQAADAVNAEMLPALRQPVKPKNALPGDIAQLIERLQRLPPGTTFEEVEGEFWGGEVPSDTLGTGYQLRINVVEGFNPPRLKEDLVTKWNRKADEAGIRRDPK